MTRGAWTKGSGGANTRHGKLVGQGLRGLLNLPQLPLGVGISRRFSPTWLRSQPEIVPASPYSYIRGTKKIMPGIIIILKRNRLLPAVAFFTVFLLLTGELFNCCHINEALSKHVQNLIGNLSWVSHHDPIASVSEGENHPHCHGGTARSQPHIEKNGVSGDGGYKQNGSCISERAIIKKSMVESLSPTGSIRAASFAMHAEPILVIPAFVNRPRPQNRSSPPIYLLTLRLIV